MEPVNSLTNTLEKLSTVSNRNDFFKTLLRCSCYETDSSFSALYLNREGRLILDIQSHSHPVPDEIINKDGLVEFIFDCKDYLVIHGNVPSFMSPLSLLPSTKSAAAFPLCGGDSFFGLLVLNSEKENLYSRKKINYLNSISRITLSCLSKFISDPS